MRRRIINWQWFGIIVGLLIALGLSALIVGCTGPQGPPGPSGTGIATGTITGKVTNSITKTALNGVKIVTDPVIGTQAITSDANGAFSAVLPIGTYKVTVSPDGYTSFSYSANLVAGQTVDKSIVLVPVKSVAVSVAPGTGNPGASITLKGTVTTFDGSSVKTYLWKQTAGVKAATGDTNSSTLTVTLPASQAYKDALLNNLRLLDRWVVQAINPEALIKAETSTFELDVVTSTGTYKTTANITASLPFDFTTGLADVPIGVPVLLNGKKQASYNWALTAPAGSTATLDNSNVRNPIYIPDVTGKYVLVEKNSQATINIYAGTWQGAITGQDAQGKPLAAACTTCHNGTNAPDNFTTWSKTGHAEILTQNIDDPAGHWTLACAGCHSVGDSLVATVKNGGFDEAIAAEGWKAPAHGDPNNWTDMLKSDPNSAKLANIQCENCHGPNIDTGLHPDGVLDNARISLSADVCASCHGEPPRHGRFQQWDESLHANYDLAISESTSSSCARCHTAQGFLTWIGQGDLTKQIQGKNGNATAAEMAAIVTPDTAQPVTCVVCHDPHNEGTTTGLTTNADPRIINDTQLLPAGFSATAVGKGAICITCHNTRNSVHNDSVQPTSYQAPHTAAQGDVLMGESAYFVDTDSRSPHSLIQDTCVTCHMEKSPAPADYSLPDNSSNHGFAADITICAKCHTNSLDGLALQAGFNNKLGDLSDALSAYMLNKLPATFTILEYTPHTVNGKSYDMKADPVSISKSNIASISLTEPHGQQGYVLKLKTAITFTYKPAGETPHTQTLTTIQAQLGDITTDGKTAVIAPTDNMVKAGWNYFLVSADGSKGVHNPQWEIDVINASINALK